MDPNQFPLPADELTAQVIHENFHHLWMELRAQTLSKQIRDFSEDGSRRFREWLRDVERVDTALGAADERVKLLALQTLKVLAGDFISRLFRDIMEKNASYQILVRNLTTKSQYKCYIV